jgi:hypothetical protein
MEVCKELIFFTLFQSIFNSGGLPIAASGSSMFTLERNGGDSAGPGL